MKSNIKNKFMYKMMADGKYMIHVHKSTFFTTLMTLFFGSISICSFAAVTKVDQTEPVVGHRVAIDTLPILSGSGIEKTYIGLPNFPIVSDQDNDPVTAWKYAWFINEAMQGTERTITAGSSIPDFLPPIGTAGQSVTLKLKALTDSARSFPVDTAESAEVSSEPMLIQPAAIVRNPAANPEGLTLNENDARGYNPLFYMSPNYIHGEWDVGTSISGPDASHFVRSGGFWNFGPKNYENPTDSDRDNIYEVTVTVTDNVTKISGNFNWKVRVLNVLDTQNPPVAQNVTVSGSTQVGSLLTGSFTYFDYENSPQGTHIYRWYRADDAAGTVNRTAISGATARTYTVTSADQGKFLVFEVTPVSTQVTTTGVAVRSVTSTIVTGTAPAIQNLTMSVTQPRASQPVSITYQYYDADGDVQELNAPTADRQWVWYYADDAAGLVNRQQITQLNGTNSLTISQFVPDVNPLIGKYLVFEAVPISKTGFPNKGVIQRVVSSSPIAP